MTPFQNSGWMGSIAAIMRRQSETFRSFFKDLRASTAPIVAFAAIPLIGSVGAAVDYGMALSLRTAMQSALDSTALTLAKQGTADQAQQIFGSLFQRSQLQSVSISASTNSSGSTTTIRVAGSGAVKTSFLSVIGFSFINISAQSTAAVTNDSFGCVLALDTTASGAVSLNGSTTVALNNCSLYSNSKDATALTVGGSATLSALSVGVVGGTSLSGNNVVTTEGIRTGIGAVADPYADINAPAFSGCTQNNYTAKTTVTIDPGVYCNGITVNAGANLTLNPGIYFIDRGSLSVNGGASVSGNGVTLVFTSSTGSNWPTVSINGNATVNLTASNIGPLAGIVIFGDRNIPTGTDFKFNGGSTQYFGGAIYVPTGAINYSGGVGNATSCTQIIGDTVNFTGNSNVAVNCSSYRTRPFGSNTARLTS